MKNVCRHVVDFGEMAGCVISPLNIYSSEWLLEFQLNVWMMILESFLSTQNVILAQTSLSEGEG